jgi:serine/threonine protein kinase
MKQYPDGVPVPKVIKALLDVSRGLVALHSMSPPVQHRDLKLENVLMSASGNYVLLDFGSWSSDSPDLSQLTREELMRFGDSVERYTTLMYRPPEMADLYKGFKVSTKVDIWMLGCILFTLINNKHPFQDASTLAIVNCKFSHDAELCKKRPWKLIELCDWLLAQNPTDRPDANLLVSILETWDDQIQLSNLPQSVVDRIEKDSKFLGIGKQSKKKSGKSTDHLGGWGGAPVDSASNPPPTNPEWKADFGDLLDIQTEKVNIEQPRRSSAPSIELPNLLD